MSRARPLVDGGLLTEIGMSEQGTGSRLKGNLKGSQAAESTAPRLEEQIDFGCDTGHEDLITFSGPIQAT